MKGIKFAGAAGATLLLLAVPLSLPALAHSGGPTEQDRNVKCLLREGKSATVRSLLGNPGQLRYGTSTSEVMLREGESFVWTGAAETGFVRAEKMSSSPPLHLD